jgi:hypothetical protein
MSVLPACEYTFVMHFERARAQIGFFLRHVFLLGSGELFLSCISFGESISSDWEGSF